MTQAGDDDENRDRGFKVEDKRRFTSEGSSRPEDVAAADPASRPAAEPPLDSAAEPRELTFSSFVIGLASQAFVLLGAVPEPQSGTLRRDLPQAKTLIDILSMLAEKTTGNLDEHEARMMEEMLYELRMHYVRELRAAGGGRN